MHEGKRVVMRVSNKALALSGLAAVVFSMSAEFAAAKWPIPTERINDALNKNRSAYTKSCSKKFDFAMMPVKKMGATVSGDPSPEWLQDCVQEQAITDITQSRDEGPLPWGLYFVGLGLLITALAREGKKHALPSQDTGPSSQIH
jgi:hypothetical protein